MIKVYYTNKQGLGIIAEEGEDEQSFIAFGRD